MIDEHSDINLLPSEIAAEEQSRRNRAYWLFALIALVALLALAVSRSALERSTTKRTTSWPSNRPTHNLQAEINSLGQFEGPLQAFEARTGLMSVRPSKETCLGHGC